MSIEIKCQALNLRVVLGVPEQISFVRLVVRTTRAFAEPVVISVLVVASQAIGLGSVCSQVFRVSKIILQLSSVARTSRVPFIVLSVGNTQTDSMLFSPGRIRKILLMSLLVHYRFSMFMFMLC